MTKSDWPLNEISGLRIRERVEQRAGNDGKALAARFYRLPNEAELWDLIANRMAAFQIDDGELSHMANLAQGLSHAEICRACDEAAKVAVLDDRRQIAREDVQRAIRLRQERKRSVK